MHNMFQTFRSQLNQPANGHALGTTLLLTMHDFGWPSLQPLLGSKAFIGFVSAKIILVDFIWINFVMFVK